MPPQYNFVSRFRLHPCPLVNLAINSTLTVGRLDGKAEDLPPTHVGQIIVPGTSHPWLPITGILRRSSSVKIYVQLYIV